MVPQFFSQMPLPLQLLHAILGKTSIGQSGSVFLGTTSLLWMVALLLLGLFLLWMFRNPRSEVSALNFGKDRLKSSQKYVSKVTFTEVAGYQEAKEELKEVIGWLRPSKPFRNILGRIPHGILLMGPPGTGKTLLAKAVAGEAQVPFFSLSGAEFVEMYVGLGAARVRDLFSQAREKAPCIVFIDELDAIGRVRSPRENKNPHEEREQTLNQLLVEMDGFRSEEMVVVIAATNRPEVLDPALLRAGRFDRQLVVDYPILVDRVDILKAHAAKLPLGEDISFEEIAYATSGFSGADLAQLVNEASILAFRRGSEQVSQEDLQRALKQVLLGKEHHSKKLSPQEKRSAAYYECGQMLVRMLLSSSSEPSSVRRSVSIIPRFRSGLDLKLRSLPDPERGEEARFTSIESVREQIIILLGGRAAEQEWTGSISGRSRDALRRATQLARKLIIEFGISASLGLQAFRAGSLAFLDEHDESMLPLSEHIRQEIDNETKCLLEDLYAQACSLIRPYKNQADQAVSELIVKETLEEAQFRQIFSLHRGQIAHIGSKVAISVP